MAEISLVPSDEINDAARWDAEAFSPVLRKLETDFKKYPRLHQLATVTHPSEIPRIYSTEDQGKPFLLAQNIRPVLPNMSHTFFVPAETYNSIPLNRLRTDDVLITRSGANSGASCVYLGKSGEAYTSGEGLIVRSLGDINGAYLTVFFNTIYGALLCRRAIYGSGQPHISPKYLERIPVPRLGKIEGRVADLVINAYRKIIDAINYYPDAETELLERIGWAKLAGKQLELSYVEKFNIMQKQGRYDAEYFHPQYKRLQRHLLKMNAKQIASFCPVTTRGIQPEFVESGDVLVIDSKAVRPQGVDPSLADRTSSTFYNQVSTKKARLREGDVLLNSTGRGTLGRATFYNLAEKAIADNHVAIIRPDQSVCLPEYLSLFLNSPAGLAQSDMFQTGSSGQLELYPQHIMLFLIYIPTNKNGLIDLEWQKKLAHKVTQANNAKSEAQAVLDKAKKIVEDSINASI